MADITLFRSLQNDEFDPTQNGGDIDTNAPIESGVLHSLLPRVRPGMAENGGERWVKFFARAEVDLLTIGFCVSLPKSPTERLYLVQAGPNTEVESEVDKTNAKLFGAFNVQSYDSTAKKVTADRDVGFVAAGDKITFLDDVGAKVTTWDVESVNGNEITFVATSSDDVTGLLASSTIYFDALNAGEYVGFWVKQVFEPFTKAMEDPPDGFSLFVWYDVK